MENKIGLSFKRLLILQEKGQGTFALKFAELEKPLEDSWQFKFCLKSLRYSYNQIPQEINIFPSQIKKIPQELKNPSNPGHLTKTPKE